MRSPRAVSVPASPSFEATSAEAQQLGLEGTPTFAVRGPKTDGIEVTSTALPGFSSGLVVAMNSESRNFGLFEWDRLFGGIK